MAISRWSPARELMSLREAMDRLFEESFVSPLTTVLPGEVGIPVDMYQTDNELVVKAAMPGVKPEDVEITMTRDTLTLKGKVEEAREVKEEGWFRRERRHGTYSRTLSLPLEVDTDRAEATFDHGVLTLTIPKAEAIRPKTLKVRTVK